MTQTHRLLLAALVAFAFTNAADLRAQETKEAKPAEVVKLAPKVAKGDTFYFLRKTETDVDTGGMGDVQNVMNMELVFKVAEVAEKGGYTADVKIGRLFGSMNVGGMMNLDFDSAKPKEDGDEQMDAMGMGAMFDQMTAAAGKTFKMKFDAQGKLVDVIDFPASLAGGGGMMGGGVTIDKKTIVEGWGQYFARIPAEGVAVGSSWKDETEGKQMGITTKNKMTHKVESAGADEVRVATTTEMEMKTDGEGAAGMPAMEMDKASMSSLAVLSRKDGLPVEVTSTSAVSMFMDAGMGEMELAIDLKESFKRVKGFEKPKTEEKKAEETKPAGGN